MRNFKNLPKSKQIELNNIFPNIMSLYNSEDINEYEKLSISVFNHWLSQDEAIKEIDTVTSKKHQENNIKLHNFCISLVNNTECYLIKLIGKKKNTVTFRELTIEPRNNKAIIPTDHLVSDHCRFVLALPLYEAIYFESSDFTHHLYFKDEQSISSFKELVNVKDLYILK